MSISLILTASSLRTRDGFVLFITSSAPRTVSGTWYVLHKQLLEWINKWMNRLVGYTKQGIWFFLFRDEEMRLWVFICLLNHGIYGWCTLSLPFCIMTWQSSRSPSPHTKEGCLQVPGHRRELSGSRMRDLGFQVLSQQMSHVNSSGVSGPLVKGNNSKSQF